MGERSGWQRQPPSSMRTWMLSMPRLSNCSTLRCAAKPIAVGGGVVLAASYEAKAFGVRGGMPGRQARALCPQLIFVGGHFKEYQRLGDAAITCSMISRRSSSGFPSTRPLPTLRAAPICSVRLPKLPAQSGTVCGQSSAFRSRSAWRAPSIWQKLLRKWPSPTGWWLSIPTPSWISFTTCLSS